MILPQFHVVEIELHMRNSGNNDKLLNRLRYVQIGSNMEAPTREDYHQKIRDVFLDDENGPGMILKYRASVATQITFEKLRIRDYGPAESYFTDWSLLDEAGTVLDGDFDPHRAACLLRYSYQPGRKGMGRMFIAGIPENASEGGVMDVTAPLSDLRVALGQTLTHAPFGMSLRPAILPSKITALATDDDRVRLQQFSPFVSYLDTRKLTRS